MGRNSGATKPIDLGNGMICASFGADASWLSLGRAHPTVGFVELNGLSPFDESRRGDAAFTRAYRLDMTLDRFAFLRVEVGGARPIGLSVGRADPMRPGWTGDLGGVRLEVEATAVARGIRQAWQLTAVGTERPPVVVRLAGRLDRPALAEITELDPPPPTGARTELRADGRVARVIAAEIDAEATIEALVDGATWEATNDALVLRLSWPADASVLRFALNARMTGTPEADPPGMVPPGPGDPITRRALAYVRGCTALTVDRRDERTMLADHRLLPLSWTRDAYWQALALLAADGPGDRDSVADHLRWLWRRCERPDGRWVRSHHADGRRKDLAFQADQQLYPMLELADFWRATGALPDGVDWTDAVAGAWQAALAGVDAGVGLMASDENAADDPAHAPYLAATQILLWTTAQRLAELVDAGALGLDATALRDVAESVRAAFGTLMTSGDEPWAYAVDGAGRRVAYHDANDLPTALAPILGFCSADDPGWRATMRFAFSPANPAWWGGDPNGLGSAHTDGAWTLGDLQAWIVARATGDDGATQRAIERLRSAAFSDGMLPEAVLVRDAEVSRVRTWFAWPGAAYAALTTLDAAGRLKAALGASRR